MSQAETDADVVIVGGGLVGSTLAAALASHPLSHGLRVTLIDPAPPERLDVWPEPSLRTSTIAPSSHAFLNDAGVWPHLPPRRAVPFADMLVWDTAAPLARAGARAPGKLHFSCDDVGDPVMGYVVDNDALRLAAFHRLAVLSRDASRVALTVLRDSVQTIDFGPDADTNTDADAGAQGADEPRERDALVDVPWPAVRLASGGTVRARLLVAADGARSRVRSLADADWYSRPYGQSAVVANVCVDGVFGTALQRFLPTGPVAMLPMCGPGGDDGSRGYGYANVIWSTSPAEAGALRRADDAVFVDELNAALTGAEDDDDDGGARAGDSGGSGVWDAIAGAASRTGFLGGADAAPLQTRVPVALSVLGRRATFPLGLGHAPRYVLPEKRTVLLGDAAHAVHPLAGQGVNLGFADARSLAGCVARAAAAGRDVGGEGGAPLHAFEARRLVANVGALATLHGVHEAFAMRAPRALRRAGMAVLNALPPAKRLIVRAMR